MKPLRYILVSSLCLLLGWLLAAAIMLVLRTAQLVRDADSAIVQLAPAAQTANQELAAGLQAFSATLEHQTDVTRSEALQRVDSALAAVLKTEADANQQITHINVTVDRAESDLKAAVNQVAAAGTDLAEQGKQLRLDVQPSIAGANLLMQRNALPAEILGTLGAAKVTAGETAQTMKNIRDAMPTILTGIDRVVDNSDHATAASAQAAIETTSVMRNFAAASKPLPLPMRVFLQVAPPLAGFAAGAATTYSAVK